MRGGHSPFTAGKTEAQRSEDLTLLAPWLRREQDWDQIVDPPGLGGKKPLAIYTTSPHFVLNARKTSDGPRDLEKSPSLERSGEGRGRAEEGKAPVICPQAILTRPPGEAKGIDQSHVKPRTGPGSRWDPRPLFQTRFHHD